MNRTFGNLTQEIARQSKDIDDLDRELRNGVFHIGLTVHGKYIEKQLSFDARMKLAEIVVRQYAQVIDLKVKHLASLGVQLEWPGVDAFVENFLKEDGHEPGNLFQ